MDDTGDKSLRVPLMLEMLTNLSEPRAFSPARRMIASDLQSNQRQDVSLLSPTCPAPPLAKILIPVLCGLSIIRDTGGGNSMKSLKKKHLLQLWSPENAR